MWGYGPPPPQAQAPPPPGGAWHPQQQQPEQQYQQGPYDASGSYDSQEHDSGGALSSAVGLVASAASGLFGAYSASQQQQTQQPPTHAAFSQPPPTPPSHHQPSPIQPSSSLLSQGSASSRSRYPPPIPVTSSLLASSPRPPIAAVSASGAPPLTAGSGPPPMTPILTTTTITSAPRHMATAAPPAYGPPGMKTPSPWNANASAPSGQPPAPLTASGPPPTTTRPSASGAATGPPPITRAPSPRVSAAAPPMPMRHPPTTSNTATATRVTPPSSPKASNYITPARAALSPRLTTTKKLPLPPPSATLERRKRGGGAPAKKFKLPPAFKSTTPTTAAKKTVTQLNVAAMPPPLTVDAPPQPDSLSGPPTPKAGTAATVKTTLAVGGPTLLTPRLDHYQSDQQGPPTTITPPMAAPPLDVSRGPPPTSATATTTTALDPSVGTVPIAAAAVDTPAPSAPEQEQLPEGWVELVDEPSGRTYYWHQGRNETVWEKPSAVANAETTEPDEGQPQQQTPMTVPGRVLAEPTQDEPHLVDSAAPLAGEETTNGDDAGLPEGWVELVEEASGRNYYWHASTGETAWEKPRSLPPDAMEPEPAPAAAIASGEPEEPQPLQEAPPETTDPVLDAERSHDEAPVGPSLLGPLIPTPAEEPEQSPPAAEKETTNDDSLLPECWVELVDEFGRTYYWHEGRNETVWEKPVALSPHVEPSEPADQSHPQPETTHETLAVPSEEVDPLPDGWTEVADETSGHVYYLNTIDGTTTWTRPTMEDLNMSLDAGQQPANDETQAMTPEMTTPEEVLALQELDQQPDEPGSSSSLPDGWTAAYDEISERYYYVHEDGTTTWELPVVGSVGAAESLMVNAGAISDMHESVEEEVAVHSRVPLVADSNNQDDGHTPELTIAPAPATDTTMAILQSINLEEEEQRQEAEVDASELPIGWVECVDEGSGRTYYFNQNDGNSSWERPVVTQEEAIEDHRSPEVAGDATPVEDTARHELAPELERTDPMVASFPVDLQVADDAQEGGEQDVDLPPGWDALLDTTSGLTYYFNSETNETSWEKPSMPNDSTSMGAQEREISDQKPEEFVELEDAPGEISNPELTVTSNPDMTLAEAPSIEEDDSASILAPDWVERVDPDSGKTYYFNEAQMRSVWEKPLLETASILSSVPIMPADIDYQEGEDVVTEELEEMSARETEEAAEVAFDDVHGDTNISEAEQLPEGWVEMADVVTGLAYFYNEKTGEATWQRPVVALVEPPSGLDETPEETTEVVDFGTTPVAEGETVREGEEMKSSLPPGWVEFTEPTSGKTYYCNETTGETTWELPLAATGGAGGAVDNGAAAYDGDHEDSGPPASADAEEILETETSPESSNGGVEQEAVEPHSDESTQDAPLPHGWVGGVDPASGKPFYFNSELKISSWERPIAEASQDPGVSTDQTEQHESVGHDDALNTVDEGGFGSSEPNVAADETTSDEAETNGYGEVGAEQPPLPAGWTEDIDPSSGRTFYFYALEDIRTWNRPTDLPNQNEINEEVAEPEAAEFTDRDTDELPMAPEVDAGESSAERSSQAAGSEPEESNAPVADTVVDPPPLPPGWVELVDRNTGLTYYHSEAENQTVWERPEQGEGVMGTSSQQEAPAQPEPEIGVEYEAGPEPGTVEPAMEHNDRADNASLPDHIDARGGSESEQALPPGWIEAVDDATGNTYYVNEANLTQWERPTIALDSAKDRCPELDTDEDVMPKEARDGSGLAEGGGAEQGIEEFEVVAEGFAGESSAEKQTQGKEPGGELPKSSDSSDLTPLPDGWLEVQDSSSGAIYFYNEIDYRTSWERPGTGEADLTAGSTDAKATVTLDNAVGEVDSSTVESRAADSAQTPLPPGWEEIEESSTGRVFYRNEAENLTQWGRPTLPPTRESNPAVGKEDSSVTRSERARRYGHAIATFGFGGRLCVWKHGRVAKHVEIHRICSLVPANDIGRIEESKETTGFVGPLNDASAAAVELYVNKTAQDKPADFLWQLVSICAKSKGYLLNKANTLLDSSVCPVNEIVGFLLDGAGTSQSVPQFGMNGIPGPAPSFDVSPTNGNSARLQKSDLEAVQNLILRGKRMEAVERALESKNFALAMVIASFCDDTDTFKNVTMQFADEVLRAGSPLHIAAKLFALKIDGPNEYEAAANFWQSCSSDLIGTWRYHLAAVISNPVKNWDTVLYGLGARLLDLGEIHAAHVCFMIAGLQLDSPIYPGCLYALLGCDHFVSEDVTFLTKEGLTAFERTEAYEWAKRKRNSDAAIKSLQPFKLQYAMVLADMGYFKHADMYLQSILKKFHWDSDEKRHESAIAARLTLAEMSYNEDAFRDAVVHFEQRLHRLVQLDPGYQDKFMSSPAQGRTDDVAPPMASPVADMTFLTAASHLPDTTLNVKDKKVIARVKRDFKKRPDDTSEQKRLGGEERAPLQADILTMPAMQPMAKSASAPLSDPPSHMATGSLKQDAPADRGPSATGPPKDNKRASKPKVEAPPKSLPVAKNDWFGLKQKVTKWLNPDATAADLGEGMQAYFDHERKVWVFPGEDPEEVAKPVGPPPTPKDLAAKPLEPTPAEKKEFDPLAAMMAPPQRTPATLHRNRGAPGGVPATPRSLYPGMPPGMPGAPMNGGLAAMPAGPPQFMVFTPKPVEETKEGGR